MKPEWIKNRCAYQEDENGYIAGNVCQEGDRWGWGLSIHGEGRNEPAMIEEGQEATRPDAMLCCDAAWVRYTQEAKP